MPSPKDRFLGALGVHNKTKNNALLNEFQTAREYFEKLGDSYTKLARTDKFRKRFERRHGKDIPVPKTTHSFFNFDGLIVCTLPDSNKAGQPGTICNDGGFGSVKFAYGEDGVVYALKKEHLYRTRKRIDSTEIAIKKSPQKAIKGERQQDLDNEIRLNRNTGQLSGQGYRGGHINDFNKKKKNRKYKPKQSYILMPYLGESLSQYWNSVWGKLNPQQQFMQATRFLWSIYCMHQGYSTQDGVGIAHNDIKPDNFVHNSHTVQSIKPIDFGLTSSLKSLKITQGSEIYWPIQYKMYSSESCDIFAALRSVFLDSEFACHDNKLDCIREEDCWILSYDNYHEIPFKFRQKYLDTQNGKIPRGLINKPANLLAAIYALRLNTSLNIEKIIAYCDAQDKKLNNDALNAIVFLAFAEALPSKTKDLMKFISNTFYIEAIAAIVPIMHVLPPKVLKATLENIKHLHQFKEKESAESSENLTPYQTLKTIAELKPEKRFIAIQFLEQCFSKNINSNIIQFIASLKVLNTWLDAQPCLKPIDIQIDALKSLSLYPGTSSKEMLAKVYVNLLALNEKMLAEKQHKQMQNQPMQQITTKTFIDITNYLKEQRNRYAQLFKDAIKSKDEHPEKLYKKDSEFGYTQLIARKHFRKIRAIDMLIRLLNMNKKISIARVIKHWLDQTTEGLSIPNNEVFSKFLAGLRGEQHVIAELKKLIEHERLETDVLGRPNKVKNKQRYSFIFDIAHAKKEDTPIERRHSTIGQTSIEPAKEKVHEDEIQNPAPPQGPKT